MIREIFNFDREKIFLFIPISFILGFNQTSHLSLSLTHTHTCTHTPSHTFSLSISLSLSHTHMHTHMHTHFLTLTLSLSFCLLSSSKWLSQREMKYERFNAQTNENAFNPIKPITSFISSERSKIKITFFQDIFHYYFLL